MATTYTPIATTTTSAGATSVTFSSISGSYTDIVAVISGNVAGVGDNITVQFNGDTGSNYSDTALYGTGTSALSNRAANQTKAYVSINTGGSGSSTVLDKNYIVQFMNYSNTTTYKTFISRATAATGSYPGTEAIVNLWRSTAAITSIVFGVTGATNFSTGTVITLYGIKAA